MTPFQIIFNPLSANEVAKMPKDHQLEFLGEFRGLSDEAMHTDLRRFGKTDRDGRTLYRFRLRDYRVYFERHPLGLLVHRILNRNTLKDFLFRTSLPTGDDEELEKNPKFWEMIEASARKVSAKPREKA